MIVSMYEYALAQWEWASTKQYEDARIILGKANPQKAKSKVVWS
jgi:hypothetical protein